MMSSRYSAELGVVAFTAPYTGVFTNDPGSPHVPGQSPVCA